MLIKGTKMKYLLFGCIFILGVLSGKMDALAQTDFDKFEVIPGCIHTTSRASCVVENKLNVPIRCEVKTTGFNNKIKVISRYSNIEIESGRYYQSNIYSQKLFTDVVADALCYEVK